MYLTDTVNLQFIDGDNETVEMNMHVHIYMRGSHAILGRSRGEMAF